MSNILLAHTNRIDSATLAGGSWSGSFPLNNLKTGDIDEVARSSNAAVTSTRLRADLGASYSLRMAGLVNHNLSTAAQWRVRASANPIFGFDADFTTGSTDSLLTASGGAGGTRVNSSGAVVSATTVRFNHSPVAHAVLGALIEAQETNLLLRSSEFGTSPWTGGEYTVSANAITGPDGASTADAIIESSSASAYHFIYQAVTKAASAITYTYTIFLKDKGRQVNVLMTDGVGSGAVLRFNPATGSITSAAATFGGFTAASGGVVPWDDGWYLVWLTATTNTATAVATQLELHNGTSNIYTGNGTSGVYAWGAGFVTGSVVRSHIPSAGTQVTRTADSITLGTTPFAALNNSAGGALYAEFSLLATSGTRPIVSLDDGTSNERIELYASGTSLKFRVIDGGATQCDITLGTIAAGTFYKCCVSWAANAFYGSLSGATAVTDTSGTLPTVTQGRLGSNQAGDYLDGHLKRVAWSAYALTTAQVEAVATSGPYAAEYDSGLINAKQLTFYGDTPSDWGAQYAVLKAFDAVTARYISVEISDAANASGYVQLGRLVLAGGFQPARNAAYGLQDGRKPLDTASSTVAGKRYGVQRRGPRTVRFDLRWLTQAEADAIHELQAQVSTLGEVFYVADPADMAHSQRYSFLGRLAELTAIDYPFVNTRAIPFVLEEKL